MEHPGCLWSSVWTLDEKEYKGIDKMTTKTIECVYIYGDASSVLGVLLLLGLILFTWMALWKIWNAPTRWVCELIG
jgi:hypothetical protein